MTQKQIRRSYSNEFTGKHFWAKGYFASTVGLDEEMIREYVRHQEESDDEGLRSLPQ